MRKITLALTLLCISLLFSCQPVPDLPEPLPATGKVTFWAKKSCAPSSTIKFTVNNATDSIVSFMATAPNCNATGAKTIELPVGVYTWKSICSTDTLSGTITIDKDQCIVVDLTFPDPPPTGKVSFWATQSCAPSKAIVFSINNTTDSVTSFTPDAPACGAAGTKTISLPLGTYNWRAICSSDTLNGTVTISKDQCSMVDISFSEPVTDTEYIKFNVKGDKGILQVPPLEVLARNLSNTRIEFIVSGEFRGITNSWGILIGGPASTEGDHVVLMTILPGIIDGRGDGLPATITKYGKVGEFIEGNFKGKIRDEFGNGLIDTEVEFKIKRTQ